MNKEFIRDFYDALVLRHDALRAANSYYYERLRSMLRFLVPRGARVLDVGCGQGDFLHDLDPREGVGVDLSPGMIEQARLKYPKLRFSVGDAEELDLQEDAFDYVIFVNTIGFLGDVQKALRSVKRLMRPDSRLVITHYNYLWEPVLKLAEVLGLKVREPLLNWLSIGDIENLLRLEGYEAVRKRQCVLLPKRVPLLASFFNRVLANLPVLWRLALVEIVVARPLGVAADPEAFSCSVIVPARNERGNIEGLVKRIPPLGRHTEIVFVEGHSTDGTLEEMQRVAKAHPDADIKVLTQDGAGKADAVRKGLEAASGDILIILDADMTVAPEELPKFYEAVSSGHGELVMGSRLVYPLEDEAMRFLNLLGNKLFSLAFSYLLEQRIKDTLCGTKAMTRENYGRIRANRDYFGGLDPFGDFDLIFGAAKANLRITEIPVRYEARRYGESQISRFRHGVLLARMVLHAVRKLKFIS